MIDPQTTLGPVRLIVADLRRALSFYEGVLGLRGDTAPDGSYRLAAGESPLFMLEVQPGARPRPARSSGLYHAAILVPSRVALAQTLLRLATTGYPLTGASDHRVSEALYLDDPDGNGIEIYADRPRQHWPMVGPEVRMTVDPLDLDAMIAELGTTPPAWTGLPAGTTIGHVHLQVGDLRAAEAFYAGILGFAVMQRFGGSALFLAAGGYHHHLGLNTWAGPGAPPPPPGSVGLHHYTIRLPNQAALKALQLRLEAAGLTYDLTPAGLWLRDPARHGLLLTVDSSVTQ